MSNEIALYSVEIVSYRQIIRNKKNIIEYCLQIKSRDNITFNIWRDYDSFINFYKVLKNKDIHKKVKIKHRPHNVLFSDSIDKYFNNIIKYKFKKLNKFMTYITNNPNIQYGINIIDDISIYKRRVK